MTDDPQRKHIIRHFQTAIGMIDQTEPTIRNLIESRLMDVAGVNRTRVGAAKKAGDDLAAEVAQIRTKAIKKAFRHLRDNLPSDF